MTNPKMTAQEERLAAIFGGNTIPEVSDATINAYVEYLKTQLSMPCYLTGIQDFWWEEPYMFGVKSKAEHDEARKTEPSYMDTYELLHFVVDMSEDTPGPMVEVQRVGDKKTFTLPLVDLKATDELSKNYQLLDDFIMWYASFL